MVLFPLPLAPTIAIACPCSTVKFKPFNTYRICYILLKILPRVCTENTAPGGASRDKYSTR